MVQKHCFKLFSSEDKWSHHCFERFCIKFCWWFWCCALCSLWTNDLSYSYSVM